MKKCNYYILAIFLLFLFQPGVSLFSSEPEQNDLIIQVRVGEYFGVDLKEPLNLECENPIFSLLSDPIIGPNWISLTPDGILSGTADESAVGDNSLQFAVKCNEESTVYQMGIRVVP